MSDLAHPIPPASTSNPDPTTPSSDPANPNPGAPSSDPRCRALTVEGRRCKNDALHDAHLCYAHAHHRHPELPDPGRVAIPLLEDHAAVRLLATQVVHGLLSLKIETDRARSILYALQIVAFTLPRPARAEAPPEPGANSPHARPDPDQVHHLALDEDGLIAADGDLPHPNAHWQPPAPGVDPLALIAAAPNASGSHPLPPTEPFTHCDCPICRELVHRGVDPGLHPHLQPLNNPHCSANHPTCRGPESEPRCPRCESVHKFMPEPRRRTPRPKPAGDSASRHASRHVEPEPEHWVSALDPIDPPDPPPVELNAAAQDEGHPQPDTPREAAISEPPASTFPLPASTFQLPASRFHLPASTFQLPASRFPLPPSRFPGGNTQNRLPRNPHRINQPQTEHPRGGTPGT